MAGRSLPMGVTSVRELMSPERLAELERGSRSVEPEAQECERCDDGWVIVDNDGDESVVRCPCQERQVTIADALALAGVPRFERGFTAAGLSEAQSGIAVRVEEAIDAGESVLLLGPSGRGKSGVALCEMIRALQGGRSARWCQMSKFLRTLREQFDAPSDVRVSEAALLRELVEPELLVIDDLGTEHVTEWAQSMVQGLICERASSGLPSIITSNLPLESERGDSIRSVFGERVASRLSRCVRLPMAGAMPDLRDRQAAGERQVAPTR